MSFPETAIREVRTRNIPVSDWLQGVMYEWTATNLIPVWNVYLSSRTLLESLGNMEDKRPLATTFYWTNVSLHNVYTFIKLIREQTLVVCIYNFQIGSFFIENLDRLLANFRDGYDVKPC